MKTVTVRLPETLVADIEAESRGRKVSKSDVIRERLEGARQSRDRRSASWEAIADVVGSVTGLPADLSGRKKAYLEKTGYAQTHHVDAGFLVALVSDRDAHHSWAARQGAELPPPGRLAKP